MATKTLRELFGEKNVRGIIRPNEKFRKIYKFLVRMPITVGFTNKQLNSAFKSCSRSQL